MKAILPALGNEFVAVIKESSMASAIGVAELTFTAKNCVSCYLQSTQPVGFFSHVLFLPYVYTQKNCLLF